MDKKYMKIKHKLWLIFTLLFLVSCSVISPTEEIVSTTEPVIPTSTEVITEVAPLPPEETATPGPTILVIWVPPLLDPDENPQAGRILLERLEEFSREYPGVEVHVRVKAESGPGGLIDSLTTARTAAPLALPELVALPYESMQAAALKGLLHPYDDLSNIMADSDWYEYAQELANLQNSTFGLPFMGDVQTLVFRPSVVEDPPLDWDTALQITKIYAFPAADPQAIFTLSQYIANGGDVQDSEGRPFIDQEKLSEVLGFYKNAEKAGVMPSTLTQYQTNEQIWDAYKDGRMSMAVTNASLYLTGTITDTAIVPIVTPDGNIFSLASGWVWALTTATPEQREISARLAEFLTESNFLAEWSEALGYLPPRPSSMGIWPGTISNVRLGKISISARLLPTQDILISLGPALENATVAVLSGQDDPLAAAETAADSLAEP